MQKELESKDQKYLFFELTEEILESMPSSLEADEITKRIKSEKIDADIFGLGFDNSVSQKKLK